MGDANVRMPEFVAKGSEEIQEKWLLSNQMAVDTYHELVNVYDMPYQDARTVLPLSTETWLIVGMPLRTFLEMYNYRACYMFYPEMRWITQEMGLLLAAECPWLEDKIKISCEMADKDGNHKCFYRGVENVEEVCTLPWAKEENRIWKSTRF